MFLVTGCNCQRNTPDPTCLRTVGPATEKAWRPYVLSR